jgi:hypothetical protein
MSAANANDSIMFELAGGGGCAPLRAMLRMPLCDGAAGPLGYLFQHPRTAAMVTGFGVSKAGY